MNRLLLAALATNPLWHALPLIVVVSLVYAATRHEDAGSILVHALRIGVWIIGFMLTVFLVLTLISWLV